jgi:hypothetical protein
MTRNGAIALCSAVLLLGAASVSDVHAQTAAIEGVARAEDGAPVPFALVRLRPADTTGSGSLAATTVRRPSTGSAFTCRTSWTYCTRTF